MEIILPAVHLKENEFVLPYLLRSRLLPCCLNGCATPVDLEGNDTLLRRVPTGRATTFDYLLWDMLRFIEYTEHIGVEH